MTRHPSGGPVTLHVLFATLFLVLAVPRSAQAQPSPRWVRFEDGYGKDDRIEDVAVDGAGNIYVAGWTLNAANNADYYIAKYDAGGTRLWHHFYDGGGNDIARSVAVRNAKVVVTGTSAASTGFGADDDAVTFVLEADGSVAPADSNALRFDFGGFHRDDEGYRVLFAGGAPGPGLMVSSLHSDTAANDTFYVAGTHRDTLAQDSDAMLLMYDSSGFLGAVSRDGYGEFHLAGMEISGDAIYLAGTAVAATGFIQADYQTLRFGADLSFGWERRYTHLNENFLLGMAADSTGVYVTGVSRSSCYDLDVATVGYAPDGTRRWVNRSYDCASGQVGTGGILIDGTDVLAAGYHANGSQYFRIRKSDGATVRSGDVPGVQSAWVGFVRSYDGNVYAGGHRMYYDSPAFATHLAKFGPDDSLRWDVQFDGSGAGGANTIRRMLANPADSSIVMVGSVTVDGQEDMMIVKYGVDESLATGVGGPGGPRAGVPVAFDLDQNYPNPFNSSTILRYRLPGKSAVSLKIYDLIGREVATLVDRVEGPGERAVLFDARDLPSGVYLARLIDGRHAQIRKIVLMK